MLSAAFIHPSSSAIPVRCCNGPSWRSATCGWPVGGGPPHETHALVPAVATVLLAGALAGCSNDQAAVCSFCR